MAIVSMGRCIYMLKPPNPRLETEPNGMVRIIVGDQIGWVSSYHLVDTKVRQLRHAWLKEHRTD